MGRLMVFTNVTLDGVMQAPGSADEDRRGGSTQGGWAAPYAAMAHAGGVMGGEGVGLRFGRRTYQQFHDVWPKRKESPFSAMLDATPKFVGSRTLTAPLPWMNSTLLPGEAADTVARLKRDQSHSLLVMGSGALILATYRPAPRLESV